MPLRIYNTITRKLEDFVPINGNRIKMFVCGPTVYDLSHIGHARTYVAYDIIAKYLRLKSYSVFFLMNITDIDDKIIKRAQEVGKDPLELADEFTRLFYEDMKALGIDSINLFAKASEHLPEIYKQITDLMKRGFAYQVDGDIYFEISKFEDYGKLSNQKPDELRKHRIEQDPRKKDPGDFSLWKSNKPGEPFWESPWGKGRPGWHIEDTAITYAYFGPQYDLHGGAIELIFPHHEAEIAQAEAAYGVKPLVKYWVHTGVLFVGGQKMSKSLGNIISIRDAVKTFNKDVLRLFFAQSHYRSQIDYDEKNVLKAKETLTRLKRIYSSLKTQYGSSTTTDDYKNEQLVKTVGEYRNRFVEAMDDDFNTPKALAEFIAMANHIETALQSGVSKEALEHAVSAFEEIGHVIGIFDTAPETGRTMQVETLIRLLLEIRDDARQKGDYPRSDNIRRRLADLGITVEDTAQGTIWRTE